MTTPCPRNLPQHFRGCLCDRAAEARTDGTSPFGDYLPAIQRTDEMPAMKGVEWRPTDRPNHFVAVVDDVELLTDIVGTSEEHLNIRVGEDGFITTETVHVPSTPEEIRTRGVDKIGDLIFMIAGRRNIRPTFEVVVEVSDADLERAIVSRL